MDTIDKVKASQANIRSTIIVQFIYFLSGLIHRFIKQKTVSYQLRIFSINSEKEQQENNRHK